MYTRPTRPTLFPYTTLFRSPRFCYTSIRKSSQDILPSDDAPEKKRKKAKKPLIGVVCLLTTGGLISVRGLGGCAASHVEGTGDRKSTRLNSSHRTISYAVFC